MRTSRTDTRGALQFRTLAADREQTQHEHERFWPRAVGKLRGFLGWERAGTVKATHRALVGLERRILVCIFRYLSKKKNFSLRVRKKRHFDALEKTKTCPALNATRKKATITGGTTSPEEEKEEETETEEATTTTTTTSNSLGRSL